MIRAVADIHVRRFRLVSGPGGQSCGVRLSRTPWAQVVQSSPASPRRCGTPGGGAAAVRLQVRTIASRAPPRRQRGVRVSCSPPVRERPAAPAPMDHEFRRSAHEHAGGSTSWPGPCQLSPSLASARHELQSRQARNGRATSHARFAYLGRGERACDLGVAVRRRHLPVSCGRRVPLLPPGGAAAVRFARHQLVLPPDGQTLGSAQSRAAKQLAARGRGAGRAETWRSRAQGLHPLALARCLADRAPIRRRRGGAG